MNAHGVLAASPNMLDLVSAVCRRIGDMIRLCESTLEIHVHDLDDEAADCLSDAVGAQLHMTPMGDAEEGDFKKLFPMQTHDVHVVVQGNEGSLIVRARVM